MSNDDSSTIAQAAAVTRVAVQEIDAAESLKDVEALRIRFLGKKSDIVTLSRSLKTVPPENRREKDGRNGDREPQSRAGEFP